METPPIVNEFTNDSFHIMNELLKSGELKKIQDDYLYWNKVKYRTDFTNKTEVWSIPIYISKHGLHTTNFTFFRFKYWRYIRQ